MLLLYAFIGLLVGGVLNVLADTLPQKSGLRMPYCAHCDVQRRPVSWLTTTGYLFAKGHCSNCGAPWSLRGVVVELGTAAVYAFLYNRYNPSGHLVLVSAYMSILILVTVIDLEHRLVLNRVILPAILLALLAAPFTPGLTWKQVLVGGLVAFVLFYLAALLYPGGMGAGDVKLAAFVGLITGFPAVFVALLVTIFAGGLISLFLVVTRIRSIRDAIPYGPFLVIGGTVALLWGQPIMDDYMDASSQARAIEVAWEQLSQLETANAVEEACWEDTDDGLVFTAPNHHRPNLRRAPSLCLLAGSDLSDTNHLVRSLRRWPLARHGPESARPTFQRRRPNLSAPRL